MTSNMKSLEDKIAELERKVEALSDECNDLKWRVITLANSKISHPRFPYWNLILSAAIPEETVLKLNFCLSALSARLVGESTPVEQQKDIDGVSRELLYGSGPPLVEEVFAAIKSITGRVDDWQSWRSSRQ